ncbi:unnamed protein product [Clonostachys byssicola]|uniref:FAD-binding domain-containing protein n=1 Tax=Clonostachys byssicola TaxID=160290 RepID=A0A9N9Y708_9HYPO|nr:unnamed protein product [Clonostachys byssicola]
MGSVNDHMQPMSATGINMLIVGAGIGGLSLAIEAHRKGHTVRIIEKRAELSALGDTIALESSAIRTMLRSWPGFAERAAAVCIDPGYNFYAENGDYLGTYSMGDPDLPPILAHRIEYHHLLYDYLRELGIEVELGKACADYFEEEGYGGVVLEGGIKITADVVVAADGVGSSSWKLVVGKPVNAVPSGFAIYRCNFPLGPALESSSMLRDRYGQYKTRFEFFLAPHGVLVFSLTPRRMSFMLGHPASLTSSEKWAGTVDKAECLPFVKGWDPICTEIINAAPPDSIIDWNLVWRDPQENWVSPKGRIVQIGDASHPFLPSAGYGGTQAQEDSMSLPECLRQAGKVNIPLALRVHNKLRFERVACCQRLGFMNRELILNVRRQGSLENLAMIHGDWLYKHDPEKYAEEEFQECASSILMGTPYKVKNSVPGYEYEPWTVEGLMDLAERGVDLEKIVGGTWRTSKQRQP